MTVAAHPKQVQGETHQHAGMGHARNGSRFSAGKSGRQETSVASEEEKVRLKIEGDREMFKLLFDLFDSI